MASDPFNLDDKDIISTNPIANFVDLGFHRNKLPKANFNQDIDEGT